MFCLNTQKRLSKEITADLDLNKPQSKSKRHCFFVKWLRTIVGRIEGKAANKSVNKRRSVKMAPTLSKIDEEETQEELSDVNLEGDLYYDKSRTNEYIRLKDVQEQTNLNSDSTNHEILNLLYAKEKNNPKEYGINYGQAYDSDDSSDGSIVLYEYRKKQ